MSRLSRKDEHIATALRLAGRPSVSGFNDVSFVHNALPEVAGCDISITTTLFGKRIKAPLIINAITGGGAFPRKINEALAVAANETGIAIAVGSQTVAMENPECADSFRIVRKLNPNGLVIANVGANSSVCSALKSIDMVSADALQIHLNVPQEIVMREGDRSFTGWLNNIAQIVRHVQVPVIVKEVGFGLSYGVAKRLFEEAGVSCFDIGGRGGTNFISIEDLRNSDKQSYLEPWGITTVASLVEVWASGVASTIVATGGIKNGLHVAKALALGAKVAGIAGVCLKVLFEQRVEGLIRGLENLKSDLKRVMLLVGAKTPEQLPETSVVITGKTREWLTERGIDTTAFARRG